MKLLITIIHRKYEIQKVKNFKNLHKYDMLFVGVIIRESDGRGCIMKYFDLKDIIAGVMGALGGMLLAVLISAYFYRLPFLWLTIGAFNMICITWCTQKCAGGITEGGVVRCAILSLFSIFLTKYFSLVYAEIRLLFVGYPFSYLIIGPAQYIINILDSEGHMFQQFIVEMIIAYISGIVGIVAIAVYKCMQIRREY